MTTPALSNEEPVIAPTTGAAVPTAPPTNPEPAPPPVGEELELNLVGKSAETPVWTYSHSTVESPQLIVPSLGPVGRRRHPLAVLALNVATLGFYNVIWHRKVNQEMTDFDVRIEVRPGASTFAVFLPWLAGFAATISGAALWGLQQTHPTALGEALPGLQTWMIIALACGVVAVPYLEMIFSPAAIAHVMTLERLRVVEERVGFRTRGQIHPVARLGLLLFPVIGWLCHSISAQRRLNAVWGATTVAKSS